MYIHIHSISKCEEKPAIVSDADADADARAEITLNKWKILNIAI